MASSGHVAFYPAFAHDEQRGEWGSDRQAPKMSWASWGNNIRLQQAQARTRRIFNHYLQRNVCWRSRDDIMFMYCILSITAVKPLEYQDK